MPTRTTEHRRHGEADEVRAFPHDGAGIVRMGEAGPGHLTSPAQGHDARAVGDEPVVVVHWYGAPKCSR